MPFPFLVLSAVLILFGVYLVALLFVDLLKLARFGKIIAASLIFLLVAGFFIFFPWSRVSDSYLIQWLSVFFSLWAGLLFYLLGVAILLALLKKTPLKANWRLLSGLGFLVALIISLIGLFQALSPKVVHFEVALDNLPSYWQGKRIVQLSDIHLDDGVYGPRFLADLVERVNNLEPDLLVLTGDIFDGKPVDIASFIKQLGKLEAIDGVLFVFGNHEHYLNVSEATLEKMLQEEGIIVLNNRAVMLDGLEVIGWSYNQGAADVYVRPEINNLAPDDGQPRLLLKHVPEDIEAAQLLGVDWQLSGHTHRGQLFPLNILTRLVFGPYHYGWHKVGDLKLYTSSGVGTWGPPLRTFNRSEIPVFDLK
ncbi:MAG: metallophosphoesterase [Candidatus Parcubacteria bacterium]|nr:MAG: hypothetical protein JST_5220 [Candidatus Parcubacteria bacterium]